MRLESIQIFHFHTFHYIGLMGLFTVVSYREFECLHGPTMYLTMLATPSSDLSKYASDTDIVAYPPARCGPAGFAEACVSTSPCAHWLSSASTMRNSYSIGGNSIYLQSIQDLYTISIYIRFLRLFGCIFGNFDFFLRRLWARFAMGRWIRSAIWIQLHIEIFDFEVSVQLFLKN